MRLEIPFTEALALATAREPLPPMVRSVHCTGSTIHAEVDLRLIPNAPTAVRLAAAAAGIVAATVTFAGYAQGVALLDVTAHARGLPAHKLLGYLVDPINAVLRRQGLPEGLVEIHRGSGDPVVAVRVQDALATRATGLQVTAIELTGAVLQVSVAVADTVRLP